MVLLSILFWMSNPGHNNCEELNSIACVECAQVPWFNPQLQKCVFHSNTHTNTQTVGNFKKTFSPVYNVSKTGFCFVFSR